LEFKKGVCYLIEDATAAVAYRLFTRLLPDLGAGFVVSRRHPDRVRTQFQKADVRVGWLAEAPGDDHFSANAMGLLAKTIQQFIQDHGASGIVLVDGLEYVIVHNGFQPTLLAFVEHLNEFIMGTQAIVLIAFRPETLDPRELALLERNLRVLEGKEVRSQLDIEDLGELLTDRSEPSRAPLFDTDAPKVLSRVAGMSAPRVDSVRCPNCGTENKADVAYCVYCGTALAEKAPEAPVPAPPSTLTNEAIISAAVKPIPRDIRERAPDFVALIGVAFFLLVVGIVFTLNGNILNDFQAWSNLIQANSLFSRPPDGIIVSGEQFFALLGLSNFLTAALKWTLDRNRFGALARVLAGTGFVVLALLLTRYAIRAVSGQLIISLWVAVLGALLVTYIAIGLYWTTTRRRQPAAEGARESPRF
jgi:hypothetical protein